MLVHVLGPASLRSDGLLVPVPGVLQQRLLCILASRVGHTVLTDALVDGLWGNDLPADPVSSLHSQVFRLRRRRRDDDRWLAGEPLGYRLTLDPGQVDVAAFDSLATRALGADLGTAEDLAVTRQALELWRGGPYLGHDDVDDLRADAVRLRETRAVLLEHEVALLLALGLAHEAVAAARQAVVEQPLREAARDALMHAAYAAGRPEDALAAYTEYRLLLDEELGLLPSAALQRTHHGVLRRELAVPEVRHTAPPAVTAPGPGAVATTTASGRPVPSTPAGRDDELGQIEAWLDEGVWAILVTGPTGIGKTTLLRALLERRPGAVWLDGRTIEPTPDAFLAALAGTGASESDLVLVDAVDHLQLIQTWLRTDLIPSRREGGIVLATRQRPSPQWVPSDPGSRELLLGPLDQPTSVGLLTDAGLSPSYARRVARSTGGYPLAVALAARALPARPDLVLEPGPPDAVVELLLAKVLADVEPFTAWLAEVVSVLRRVDEALLTATVGHRVDDVAAAWRAVGGLPFAEHGTDGVRFPEIVRRALEHRLEARDPEHRSDLRRRAAAFLSQRAAVHGATWRTTADLIFLTRHPVVRDALFPPDGGREAVAVPLEPEDRDAVEELMSRLPGDEPHRLGLWMRRHPDAFRLVRTPNHPVGALGVAYLLSRVHPEVLSQDPYAAAVKADCADLHDGEVVLVRLAVAADGRESGSPALSGLWIDVKRLYLDARPRLRRVYTAAYDPPELLPVLGPLGFQELPHRLDDVGCPQPLRLDMGPGGVEEWLARLVVQGAGSEPA